MCKLECPRRGAYILILSIFARNAMSIDEINEFMDKVHESTGEIYECLVDSDSAALNKEIDSLILRLESLRAT